MVTTWKNPYKKKKVRTTVQKWSFERLFHNAGTLARTKTAITKLVLSESTLPNERISLLLALDQLNRLDFKLNRVESLKRYKKKIKEA
jgi:hypothetical protein